nr:hypothetical protein [Staphylococcus epidermidis]
MDSVMVGCNGDGYDEVDDLVVVFEEGGVEKVGVDEWDGLIG